MSIPITIELDTTAVERALSDIGRKQVPFALALTINDLAAEVKSKEIVANKVDLDRPTPFTSKGIFIVRANKSTLQGQVGYKDRQADYLDKQVTGGKKRAKKKAIVVPVAMKLNKYGNLPRNALSRQSPVRMCLLVRSRVLRVYGSGHGVQNQITIRASHCLQSLNHL